MRAVSIGLVTLLVISSLFGLTGVKSDVARASASGYTLAVTHASVTRGGLATPFMITLSTSDGSPLPDEITLKIATSYLSMFDENGLDPMPVASFSDRTWTWWTFSVERGLSEMEVNFDARLEPAVQRGQRGSVSVVVEGQSMVKVEFETRVFP